MKKFNLYNSKIFKFFDYCFRLVLINLLILVPSFLLFYIVMIFFKDSVKGVWEYLTLLPALLYMYPAICAGIDLIKKFELKECNTVFKEFFKSLKRVYLKALLETFIILIFVVLFFFSIRHFYLHLGDGIINSFGLFLAIAFAIMLLVIIVHLPLVMIYFDDLNIKHYVKLSLIFGFKDLGLTLLLTFFVIATLFLSYLFSFYLVLIAFSLLIYLIVKFTKNKYLKISERNK